MFVLSEIVDQLGCSYFTEKCRVDEYIKIVQVTCSFCNNSDTYLRNVATYTLGSVAKQCSRDVFDQISYLCLASLMACSKFKTKSVKCKKYAHENLISALGKLIKHQEQSLLSLQAAQPDQPDQNDNQMRNLVAYWFYELPLEEDYVESSEQLAIISDYLAMRPDFIFDIQRPKNSNLAVSDKLCQIYHAGFTDKKVTKKIRDEAILKHETAMNFLLRDDSEDVKNRFPSWKHVSTVSRCKLESAWESFKASRTRNSASQIH